jgi:hypothetical protein
VLVIASTAREEGAKFDPSNYVRGSAAAAAAAAIVVIDDDARSFIIPVTRRTESPRPVTFARIYIARTEETVNVPSRLGTFKLRGLARKLAAAQFTVKLR